MFGGTSKQFGTLCRPHGMLVILDDESLWTYPAWLVGIITTPNHYPLTPFVTPSVRTRSTENGSTQVVIVVSIMESFTGTFANGEKMFEFGHIYVLIFLDGNFMRWSGFIA